MKQIYLIFPLVIILSGCPEWKSEDNVMYITDIYFDESSLTLSGTEQIIIPQNKYKEEIIINLWANIYRKREQTGFYKSSESDYIFEQPVIDMDISEEEQYGWININKVECESGALRFNAEGTKLVIDISGLSNKRNINITIEFEQKIPKIYHRTGFYNDIIWLGNWLPILAVYENGEWKTNDYYFNGDPFYSECADYSITVNTPAEYTVAGSGKENSIIKDNRKITNITAENIRDHGMFIAKNINTASIKASNNVNINFYSYSLSDDEVEMYLKEIPFMFEFYESYTGPYTYQEFDIIECRLMAYGMEYPGFVMIMEDIFKNPDDARRVIVHELGHQWFYGIIGNNQITNAWFDEGAATFFERLYLAEDNVTQVFSDSHDSYSYIENIIMHSGPVLESSYARAGTRSGLYYKYAYDYGALMFTEVYISLGKDLFTELMNNIYNDFKFGIITKQDFINECLSMDKENISKIFRRYFDN